MSYFLRQELTVDIGDSTSAKNRRYHSRGDFDLAPEPEPQKQRYFDADIDLTGKELRQLHCPSWSKLDWSTASSWPQLCNAYQDKSRGRGGATRTTNHRASCTRRGPGESHNFPARAKTACQRSPKSSGDSTSASCSNAINRQALHHQDLIGTLPFCIVVDGRTLERRNRNRAPPTRASKPACRFELRQCIGEGGEN
jgi:hypothetical protein